MYRKHDKTILTPTQNLALWKSTVLPRFLQNLRYIQSANDVKKPQTSSNLFLSRALHVYGDYTALLADTGTPPLALIQYTHLAQMHFCLTKTRPYTLPAMGWLRLVCSFKSNVSFAKEPYKRDYNLQKRPIFFWRAAARRTAPKLPCAIRVGPNEGSKNFCAQIPGVYPIFRLRSRGFISEKSPKFLRKTPEISSKNPPKFLRKSPEI